MMGAVKARIRRVVIKGDTAGRILSWWRSVEIYRKLVLVGMNLAKRTLASLSVK